MQDSLQLTIEIHPIVILSISEFYNRSAVNFGSKRVYGGLVGVVTGNKVEVFSTFEFLDKTQSINLDTPPDFDLEFLDNRKRIAEQLYSEYQLVGFFSVNTSTEPSPHDRKILEIMKSNGVVSPIYLVLGSNLLECQELPLNLYSFDRLNDTFKRIKHTVVGFDSERICLDTVTKSGGTQQNDPQQIQNITTVKNALGMLKSNLQGILKAIDSGKFNQNRTFQTMLSNLLSNYPDSKNPDTVDFLKNSIQEVLILNNISSSSIGMSYQARLDDKHERNNQFRY